MLLNNAEKLELLVADAEYLQQLADEFPDDITEIATLTDLATRELANFQVKISDGLVETVGIDEDLNSTPMFAYPDQVISGDYKGLRWRYGRAVEGTKAEPFGKWYLCHAIACEEIQYTEQTGNDITVSIMANVPVVGSKISNESFTSSHNYELIADDPVCEEIDTLMTNDDMTLQQKADRVASLFLRSGRKNSVLSTTEIEKHRISYLNHVGLFSGSLVVSSVAYQEIENSRYIKTSSPDQPFIGVVEYVGLDLQFGKSQHLKLRELGLSYELTFPDVGAVSLPHMLGYTLISSPDEF
ncbi:MAG TPA: hypothetical protein PKD20_01305 [Candidatus Saccharibacteria bacterium]|jgi:hypothetical protein|nr:hypothetical protein [Candidatus Saccharibacteria bacterium]HMT55494.1 hypothetical protein [Candidatus Saccharibacteria bacterium]